jgi:hypothetical protein
MWPGGDFGDVDAGHTYHVWADLPGAGGRASAPAGTRDLVVTLRPER